MKKRYIALIVLLATVCVAGVAFLVYKNWAAIIDIVNFVPKKPKDPKLPEIKVPPVKPVNEKAILNSVKPSEDDLKEREDIAKKELVLSDQTKVTFDKAIKKIQAEASMKELQAKPLSNTVIENAKQKATKMQKAASDKYRELLKLIELEKAKAAIVLTGTRTEKEKASKLNKIDALDMELELYAENRIRNSGVRRPLSKIQAEYLVYKGIV